MDVDGGKENATGQVANWRCRSREDKGIHESPHEMGMAPRTRPGR